MSFSSIRDSIKRMSISSRGARHQFEIAVVLIAIIPFLVLVYFGLNNFMPEDVTLAWWLVILFLIFLTMVLGFALLIKYPRTIISIRDYLKSVAEGEMPEVVHLLENESDITAIEEYFNMIIEQMRERVTTIRRQREKLIKAEREKVMTETICTTCHHLGQPATSITCYLELLRMENLPAGAADIVQDCIEEANRLRERLGELQSVTQYKTEAYIDGSDERNFPDLIQMEDDQTSQAVKKMRRSIDRFVSAYNESKGLYSEGSLVELTNGSVAMIVKNCPEAPARPKVRIVIDENGDHPSTPREMDLRLNRDISIAGPMGGSAEIKR